ncbi:hypothetical protein QBC42DRAFT_313655 [Cladorrhinum samala]|uniref:Glycosyl transferase n=1 Tax=Cladorrhinum samala TaxID=585594 RepID=A0AAV9I044_9PEZI|nr:hypothetical protein QBC42DRAFT_313655 [Cladorrhinum samala]
MLPSYSSQSLGKSMRARFMLKIIFICSLILFSVLLLFPPDAISRISSTILASPPPYNSPSPGRDAVLTIPDTLHYVYILSDPDSPTASFNFHFSHLLSIYAARHYLRPSQIYIHTNALPSSPALNNSSQSKWTKLILTLPELSPILMPAKVPTRANNGVALKGMEHKSDFVRVEAIHAHGGIYIDWDVHPLRSIRPLLQSGFRAVAGRQKHGQINSGVFMSVAAGRMISLWKKMMHEAYDGGWTTHSNQVVTDVAERLGREEGEMLIMDRESFAPGSWEDGDTDNLFGLQNVTKTKKKVDLEKIMRKGATLPSYEELEGFAERWEHPERFEEWETDWSKSYLLHAFTPHRWNHKVEGFTNITPRYVLERTSNFARAVYPAAKLLYERGLIGVEDLDDW